MPLLLLSYSSQTRKFIHRSVLLISTLVLLQSSNNGIMTSAAAATQDSIRNDILTLMGKDPNGHLDENIRGQVSSKLLEYSTARNGDTSDVLFAIGKSVFGVTIPPPSQNEQVVAKKRKLNGDNDDDDHDKVKDVIIDFDYMKQFMKDVFLTYGCTEDQAETSSEVLIEADKRGIDSHGLGRLKPIYCDRIDKGILWANKPIDVIKETETTALVDGNLGLGLYIGPYCMQMAIEKAKKYGVGFVVCQNSTHYGIAGYYATMATEAGCVGFTGTNARPSIAPTFGVEPMLGKKHFGLIQKCVSKIKLYNECFIFFCCHVV